MTNLKLPESAQKQLANPAFHRTDVSAVHRTLADLCVAPSADFIAFFERYVGPFASPALGYELSDISEGSESIYRNTLSARRTFSFPDNFLVISNYLAGSVLVLDAASDRIYDVDFEGGLDDLRSGGLAPRWQRFVAFLNDFFKA